MCLGASGRSAVSCVTAGLGTCPSAKGTFRRAAASPQVPAAGDPLPTPPPWPPVLRRLVSRCGCLRAGSAGPAARCVRRRDHGRGHAREAGCGAPGVRPSRRTGGRGPSPQKDVLGVTPGAPRRRVTAVARQAVRRRVTLGAATAPGRERAQAPPRFVPAGPRLPGGGRWDRQRPPRAGGGGAEVSRDAGIVPVRWGCAGHAFSPS